MQRLSELITSLHKQGLVQTSWQQFAEDASELFQADGCSLCYHQHDNDDEATVFGVGSLDAKQTDAVIGISQETPVGKLLRDTPVGQVVKHGDINISANRLESESSSRLSQIVAATVYRDDRYEAIFSFGRNHGRDQFAQSDVQLLSEFIPYLKMVIESYFQELRQQQSRHQDIDILHFVEQFSDNLAVIDETGAVAVSNRAFNQLRTSKSLLYVYGGKVKFYDKSVELWMENAMKGKLKAPLCHFHRLPQADQECIVKISAFHYTQKAINSGERRYFLLSIANSDVKFLFEQYKQLFNLTKAEAELAAYLSMGKSINDLASQKLLSKHTLRTQLKSVFLKTQTHSQNELVVLLKNVV